LNFDDDLRLAEFFREAGILPAQLLIFFRQRVALGFRAAFLQGQRLQDSVDPLAPPSGQVRGVQAFATKQSAGAARRAYRGFGFLQNAQFVFGSEGTALRLRNHLGIGSRKGIRRGARLGSHSTPLRLAALAFAPFRGCPTPRTQHLRRAAHCSLFPSRPAQ